MRLGFATCVLLAHSFELLDGNRGREPLTRLFHTISLGELGVDCFFILSGFLITRSWDREPNWTAFLRKRVLRIYPGFIVAYVISMTVVGAVGAVDPATYLRLLNPLRMVRELALLQAPDNPPTFPGLPYPLVNGAMWTIHYEFLCYLLVLGLGVFGLLRRPWPVVALWLGTLALFLAFRIHRIGAAGPGAIMGGDVVTMLRFVPLFLAGAAFAKTRLHERRPTWLIVLAAAALLLGLTNPGAAEVALATAGAYLLFVVGFRDVGWSRLGAPDVSYGVYLYGWPVQNLLLHFHATHNPIVLFMASTAASLALGVLSWNLVEKGPLALTNVCFARQLRPRAP